MSRMPAFDALQLAFMESINALRQWTSLVEAGDFASPCEARLPSPDATPTYPLLCSTHKCREGREL